MSKKMDEMRIVLASASPRRKELLTQIGWQFEICVSHVEERITRTVPAEVVEELSGQKAADVYAELREEGAVQTDGFARPLLVIGADTIVACDGDILGKPKSREEAVSMLKHLQGRSHYVYTGVTLMWKEAGRDLITRRFHEETEVIFAPMTQREIESYVDTGEPFDKAGAYGIQGVFARYIQGLHGDYSNVVGLPVGRLYREVRALILANTPKKAVLFDLDGTLSDSIASIKFCADQAMALFGYGPFTIDQYKYFVGDGAANLIKRCLQAGGDRELTHFEEAYAAYRQIFRLHCMYEVKPYEGMEELLAVLKERGIKLAVLSNKPHEETIRVIETLFGKGCFDVIQGQKPGIPIKPDPEGGFRILEELRIEPEEALYLGDTGTDMRTGKALGALTVGVLWGFRKREELLENHADQLIARPSDLLNLL